MAKKLGSKRIWLKGSRRELERIVYKREDGTYFCIWYHEKINVYNVYGFEEVTAGWVTVEEI